MTFILSIFTFSFIGAALAALGGYRGAAILLAMLAVFLYALTLGLEIGWMR